jgi:hypothetical protein
MLVDVVVVAVVAVMMKKLFGIGIYIYPPVNL